MERVIGDAGPRSLMLLATAAGRPLYLKLGFETIGVSHRHVGDHRAEPTCGDGVQRLKWRDLDAVVELDAQAMGTPRPRIIEHLVEVGDGVTLNAAGGIAGYAIRRPFGTGHVIGPIVAPSEEDAAVLFRAVARPGLTRVDCPGMAHGFGALLAESGLGPQEASQVMVRGAWPRRKTTVQSYAMASHAWG